MDALLEACESEFLLEKSTEDDSSENEHTLILTKTISLIWKCTLFMESVLFTTQTLTNMSKAPHFQKQSMSTQQEQLTRVFHTCFPTVMLDNDEWKELRFCVKLRSLMISLVPKITAFMTCSKALFRMQKTLPSMLIFVEMIAPLCSERNRQLLDELYQHMNAFRAERNIAIDQHKKDMTEPLSHKRVRS